MSKRFEDLENQPPLNSKELELLKKILEQMANPKKPAGENPKEEPPGETKKDPTTPPQKED